MKHFRKILSYAKPYAFYAFLNILFNILYAIFNVLTIVAFIPVLNILFQQEQPIVEPPEYNGSLFSLGSYVQDEFYYFISQKMENEGAVETLFFVCILSLSLFFFKNLFRYFALFFLCFLRNGVVKDLRDLIYHKIIALPISYFSERKKGDTLARITSDVQQVEHSFMSSIEALVREPLTMIISLVIMLIISTKLTLFVFVLLPISGIIISSISKKLKVKSLLAQQEMGAFMSFVEETLSGLKIIKGFNAEKRISVKFQASTNRFRRLMNSVIKRQELGSPVSEFLGSATIIVILWYGGQLVLDDASDLKPEQFLTYIGLFYLILNPVKQITSAFYKLQKGDASAERILNIIEAPITIKDKPNAIAKQTFEQDITFENVSFKYEEAYVLKNFSLTIKKGETVALVGPSGSGKSTIANLLPRFYEIEEGVIKIDGIDIRDLKQHDLRQLIGLVTQDSVLFNDSIKNNLCLSVDHATDEEIIHAIKVANAYGFIKDLPKQLEHNIGDAGNRISGGQKQRLNIARAVLKNPDILILDEATSALDNESEKLVQEALEKMTKNSTSLVIAHRLSTIQNADLIVVMKNGEIVEQGKHEDLLGKKGNYFDMLNSRSLGSEF